MQKNINYIKHSLHGLYPNEEIETFVVWIFEYLMNYSRTQLLMYKEDVLEPHVATQVKAIVKRLKKFEPIQYILGQVEFFGLNLNCKPGVLIPRPETEELITLVGNTMQNQNIKVLDIGTGSGCIALALKSQNKDARVFGCDVSETALRIAVENAIKNALDVTFFKYNILNQNGILPQDKFDLIVSNPPYVLESEKALMNENVLSYEPHLALFVDDDDALLFYRSIVEFATLHLNAKGYLWFEINEAKGDEVSALMRNNGFSDVEVIKDIFGKARFVKGEK